MTLQVRCGYLDYGVRLDVMLSQKSPSYKLNSPLGLPSTLVDN